MLISSLRSTNLISTFFVTFLLWVLNFSLTVNESLVFYGPDFYDNLYKVFIAMFSVLGVVIVLNMTMLGHKFVGVGDGLVGAVFMGFMLGLTNVSEYYKELFSLFVLTVANARLISLHNKPKNLLKEFELGILVALAIVISPSYILLLPMLLIGVTLVVPLTWRDVLAPLLGVFWVVLVYAGYIFWTNNWNVNNVAFAYPKFNAQFDLTQVLITVVSLFEFLVLVTLFGVIEKRGIKERVYYWIWIWTAVFLFVSLLFFQKDFSKVLLIQLLGLPCAVFSIEFFKPEKRGGFSWKKELVFYAFLVLEITFRLTA